MSEQQLRTALILVDNWLVTAAITTPGDFQNGAMIAHEIIEKALKGETPSPDNIIFRWETAPHSTFRTSQICDVVHIGRLYARRIAKNVSTYSCYINGIRVLNTYKTIDAAKEALEVEAKRRLTHAR